MCEEYLVWFSGRTIVCSLRDLIKDYPFGWNEESVPQEQVERYEQLIKTLTIQKAGNEKEIKDLLKELMVLDTLQTIKMQKLLKKLRNGKKVIIKKRWEFFEKEEGHLYEKIGDGVYIRK